MISNRYSLFVSNLAFFNLLLRYSSNVIYHELNGLIHNSELNFSIYLDDFQGTVIFARDFRDKFHLKLEMLWKTKAKVILFSNDRVGSLEIESLCGCEKCSVKNLKFILLFSKQIFTVICNNRQSMKIQLLAIGAGSHQVVYHNFPKSKNYGTNQTKIDIWMANIGQFKGYKGINYYGFREQLKGCLEYFYHYNKSINIKSGEDQFTSPCPSVSLTEIIDYGTRRIERTVTASSFNCSLSVVNKTYCKVEDLHTYNSTYQTYQRIWGENKTVKLTFKWKQNFRKNYCLLELKMKDGSTILFTVDTNFQIFLAVRNDSTGELKKEMLKEVEDYKNILSLDFGSTRYLKISSGNCIYWHEKNEISEPILINVGKSRYNQCVQYEGPYEFQYDSSLFEIQKERVVARNFRDIIENLVKKLEYQIIFIVILLIMIINFTWILCKSRRPKLQKQESVSNIYENQFGLEIASLSLEVPRNQIDSGIYETLPDI